MYQINEDVVYVKGAVNGAIYDFNTEKVYSINQSACDILDRYVVEKNINADRDYLDMLSRNNLISDIFKPQYYKPPINDAVKLEMAWIEVTQKCNMKCIHCYEGNDHYGFNDTLSLAQWKNVIRQLVDAGINRLIIIGGEPACYSNIIEIIDYISDLNIDVTLFTNATCFSKELFNCVVKNNINVKVSIYGHNAQVHDMITQMPGSFDKMIHWVKKLIFCNINVSSAVIIMKENQEYLNDIIHFVKETGMKYSRYDTIREVYGGTQTPHVPTNMDILNNVYFTKPNFRTSEEKFIESLCHNTCWYGKISIMENGDVIPCEFEREYIYGNVLCNTIDEIIHSKRTLSKWFFDFSKIDECKDCEFRFACSDCRPLGRAVCGDIRTKNPRCCYDVYSGKFKKIEIK